MAASTTSVNDQFDTERAAQIAEIRTFNAGREDRRAQADARDAQRQDAWDSRVADGKLIPLGDGRFRVNQPGSWDDGEVFTARQAVINGLDMIIPMPEHGLAEKDGKVSLYSRQPEWHSLGNIIPEGTSDVDEVLRLGGIDWEASKVPSLYRRHGAILKDERSWHIVRNDNDYSLGTVGSAYRVFQNSQAASFLHELVNDHGVVFETAGELRDGESVFITLRMPEDLVIDQGGLEDKIRPYIAWLNAHNGKGKARVITTPWRIRCGNTHAFSIRDAIRSFGISHSGDLDRKVEEARKALDISVNYYERLQEEETLLARTPITFGQFDAVISEIWAPKDEPSKRESGIADRRHDALRDMFASYSVELGQTAYAGENVFTDWFDHVAPRRALNDSMAAARATAIMEDDDLIKKSTVHRALLTLTNR